MISPPGIIGYKGCIAFVAIAASACSGSGSPEITTSIPAPTDSLRLVEDLRVGDADDEDAVLFKSLGHVAVDADQNVYAVDWMDAAVHVMDSAGRPLHRIGRRGTGPGEFEYPSIIIPSDDSVIVFRARSRFSVFERASGAYRDQYTLPDESPYAIAEIISLAGDAFLFRLANDIPDDQDVHAPDRVVRVAMDSGQTTDLLELPGRDLLISRNEGGAIDQLASAPFGYRSTCAASLDRVFCGWSGDNRFVVLSANGDSTGEFAIDFSPLDVTAADRDPMVERYAGTGYAKNIHFNPRWPAYDSIFGDDQGRLWIKVRETRNYDTTTLWVVDVDARSARAVTVDGNMVPAVVRDGQLYGRLSTPEGAQVVVRYRIDST